jgi:hypothetical protein
MNKKIRKRYKTANTLIYSEKGYISLIIHNKFTEGFFYNGIMEGFGCREDNNKNIFYFSEIGIPESNEEHFPYI